MLRLGVVLALVVPLTAAALTAQDQLDAISKFMSLYIPLCHLKCLGAIVDGRHTSIGQSSGDAASKVTAAGSHVGHGQRSVFITRLLD